MGPCWDAIPNAPVTSYANAGEIAGVAHVGSARLSVALYSEATAAHAAERWGLSAFRFVQRCGLGASCPRKPPVSPA